MKAISVRQPWADLIRLKLKRLEIRSWTTEYRGDVLICASREWDSFKFRAMGASPADAEKYPVGVAVCLARLAKVRPYRNTLDDYKASGGVIWKRGLRAFELEDIEAVAPTPVRGQLGLFSVPWEVSRKPAVPCPVTPGCPGAGMDGDGREAVCGCPGGS